MGPKLVEQIALFRYGVFADLVHLEPGTRGIYFRLAEKARQSYLIPGTSRTRVAAETLRDGLASHRRGGFAAGMDRS
jgi:putative transposase